MDSLAHFFHSSTVNVRSLVERGDYIQIAFCVKSARSTYAIRSTGLPLASLGRYIVSAEEIILPLLTTNPPRPHWRSAEAKRNGERLLSLWFQIFLGSLCPPGLLSYLRASSIISENKLLSSFLPKEFHLAPLLGPCAGPCARQQSIWQVAPCAYNPSTLCAY